MYYSKNIEILLPYNYNILEVSINNRFKSSISIYLFLVILILIISFIINYKVSISETSINKVPKRLTFYLNISFSLKPGI
jgi:hypothetical protein